MDFQLAKVYIVFTTPSKMLTKLQHLITCTCISTCRGICSSYEGMHGNIRYRMEAEIGQKWKLFNDKLRKDFIVSTVTDTNRPEFQV